MNSLIEELNNVMDIVSGVTVEAKDILNNAESCTIDELEDAQCQMERALGFLKEVKDKYEAFNRDPLQNIRREEGQVEGILEGVQIERSWLSIRWDAERTLGRLTSMKVRKEKNNMTGSQQQSSQAPRPPVSLPNLTIPKFDGDLLKFRTFWQIFNSTIGQNEQFSDIQKFHYLVSFLTGSAQERIAGLDITSENYAMAVKLLHERFGDTKVLVAAHCQQLQRLPSATNHHSSLRATFDQVEICIRNLQNLGQDIDSPTFHSTIIAKFPISLRIEVERKRLAQDMNTEDLLEELKILITAQERAFEVLGTTSKPSVTKRHFTTEALLGVPMAPRCVFCGGSHWSDECGKFPSIKDRKSQIKNRCYKCLGNHNASNCSSQKPCFHCRKVGIHHRSLCPSHFPGESGGLVLLNEREDHQASENAVPVESEGGPAMVAMTEGVSMQTFTTFLVNPNTQGKVKVRGIMDCGSQRTYISQKLRRELGLPSQGKQMLSVYLFGRNQPCQMSTDSCEVVIDFVNGTKQTMGVNVVPTLIGKFTNTTQRGNKLSVSHWKNIQLSDDEPDLPIDILIGNDYYYDIVKGRMATNSPGLYLLDTKVGWILSGRSNNKDVRETVSFLTVVCESQEQLESPTNDLSWIAPYVVPARDIQERDTTRHLWELDVVGIRESPLVTEDDASIQSFKDSIAFIDNRYFVSWPYKFFPPPLPTNYGLSLGRLKSLMARLKNPEVLKEYDKIIQNQLQLGIIEKIDEGQQDGVIHYLPHHAVITPEKTTTKVRIVFDASSKARKSEKSLNECLYRGRVLLEDVVHLLMRFRLYRYAVTADIEKAFLQIGLHKEDRDVTRFLWLKDFEKPVTNENLQVFRFSRVAFGVISSPFLLEAVVKFHLLRVNTVVSRIIADNIYVDNVVVGCETEGEVQAMYEEGRRIFSMANMNLREWKSNAPYFVEKVNGANSVQVLGLVWHLQGDTLSVKSKRAVPGMPVSKRSVYSYVSSFFDPLGLLCPLILPAKIFLQSIWRAQLDWDEELSPQLVAEWEKVKVSLAAIHDFKIPRSIGFKKGVTADLHCFCDASKEAYAAVIYLRFDNSCRLLFAKARVAPVGGVSIPRLELLGVLIGVRCLIFVEKGLEVTIGERYVWTDSQCVLHWIRSDRLQPLFIENRLKEIRKTMHHISFRYVSSEDNPADLATRGSWPQGNPLWWDGPGWLKRSESSWPEHRINTEFELIEYPKLVHQVPEKKASGDMVCTACTVSRSPFLIDERRYQSLKTLLSVTAYCLRFIGKCRKLSQQVEGTSLEELEDATVLWERHVQEKHFGEEINFMEAGKKSTLQVQLGLWLDERRVVRCKGRVVHQEFTFSENFPKLLPSGEYFTTLVICRVHWRLAHAGVSHTLAEVRKTYWVLKGRATVKKVLKLCQVCRKYGGGPFKLPEMADLPLSRITRNTAFSFTGIDYLGPLSVKSREEGKVWICVFTCMVTRAVHLEVAEGLGGAEFLLAFRRFVGRRGTPKMVLSDNAAQFHSTKLILDEAWKGISQSPEFREYLAQQNIRWKFITALAPWKGGVYERVIAMIKQAVKKSVGRVLLTFIQLTTLVVEIEAVLNSRPLVYVGEDISSNNYLTPAHFLGVRGLANVLCGELTTKGRGVERKKLIESWKKGQEYLEEFWRQWKQEYLTSLRERTQRTIRQKRGTFDATPKIGTIVHIGDSTPRGTWKLGKIIQLEEGEDGKVRSAKVHLATGRTLTRSVAHLYPVEIPVDE